MPARNSKSGGSTTASKSNYLKLGDFDLPSGDKIRNAFYFGESNIFKFTIEMEGLTLYDASYRKSENDEWFVGGPVHKGKDDKWYSYWKYSMPEDDQKALEKFLFNKAGL